MIFFANRPPLSKCFEHMPIHVYKQQSRVFKEPSLKQGCKKMTFAGSAALISNGFVGRCSVFDKREARQNSAVNGDFKGSAAVISTDLLRPALLSEVQSGHFHSSDSYAIAESTDI